MSKHKISSSEFLSSGDIIDIVAPASNAPHEELEHAARFLENQGFVPRFSPEFMKGDFCFAQTDEFRLKDFKRAISAKDSKIVWSLRGGYGSMRILPALQKMKKPNRSKLFVGLSDVTALHIFLNQNWKWPTLHCPMVSRLNAERQLPAERDEVLRVLKGVPSELEYARLTPLNNAAKKLKKVQGQVVGGNLVTLEAGLGTFWQIKTLNKILFLEEVSERGYRLDRSLEHLRQAKVFDGVRAVVFGDIVGGDEADGSNLTWQAVERFASAQRVPVFSGVESGHGKLQRPLPFLANAELSNREDGGVLVCEWNPAKWFPSDKRRPGSNQR